MSAPLHGVYPVLTTPYAPDGSIDLDALRKEIDYVFDIGAQGITFALVSDLLRLTAEERMDVPGKLVSFAADRGPVIMSVGAESVRQMVEYARAAEDAGIAAVMAIPPISVSVPDPGEYFRALAAAVSVPVIVQDAGSYVGGAMDIGFQAELWRELGVWFKPEATPLGQKLSALRDATEGRAVVFEGSGGMSLVDSYRRGISGTMPGCDLLDGIVALWDALERGDDDAVYEIFLPICAVVSIQIQGGLDGFMAIERYLLTKRGILPEQTPRQPFTYELDRETREEIDRLFDRLMLTLQ